MQIIDWRSKVSSACSWNSEQFVFVLKAQFLALSQRTKNRFKLCFTGQSANMQNVTSGQSGSCCRRDGDSSSRRVLQIIYRGLSRPYGISLQCNFKSYPLEIQTPLSQASLLPQSVWNCGNRPAHFWEFVFLAKWRTPSSEDGTVPSTVCFHVHKGNKPTAVQIPTRHCRVWHTRHIKSFFLGSCDHIAVGHIQPVARLRLSLSLGRPWWQSGWCTCAMHRLHWFSWKCHTPNCLWPININAPWP